ncbi:MAG TPA: SUMF1/EgtB/PvdO family nonheme iron enzyme [Rhizomicrobium sp.]
MFRIAVVAAALMISGSAACADDQSAWLPQRQAQFAQWQTGHRSVEAQITNLKTKTAALVAQHQARGTDPRYRDLLARSRAMRPVERKQALALFDTGISLWKSGDFTSAAAAFRQGLDIDPANGPANYYLGDSLMRQGDQSGAAEYMSRAATLGGAGAEAFKAKTALQGLPAAADPALMQPPAIFHVAGAPTEIWDAPAAPQMVVIPAGEYTMGSAASEQGRLDDESPQHRVTIAYSLAVGAFDVTRDEYAEFAAETNRQDPDSCFAFDPSSHRFNDTKGRNWRDPGFPQTGRDPVVCVNWDDAMAYAQWLSLKTGHSYRLLSESEWEYAARAGTATAYYWGDSASHEQANYSTDGCCDGLVAGRDQWLYTSPAGSFQANAFGLYDMLGNVWQWTQDCYNKSYEGALLNGSVWQSGDCGQRVLRGGTWGSGPRDLRSANRFWDTSSDRVSVNGFRVARTL